MVNKQKIWFLTLFSLILVLSVYYITMPSELLTTSAKTDTNKVTKTNKNTNVKESDALTLLQVELDEEKNTAYDGLKEIDNVKAKEEKLKKKIKKNMKLSSFVKINGNSISITIKKQDHSYSLANEVMRLVQEEFTEKMYISVKFQK